MGNQTLVTPQVLEPAKRPQWQTTRGWDDPVDLLGPSAEQTVPSSPPAAMPTGVHTEVRHHEQQALLMNAGSPEPLPWDLRCLIPLDALVTEKERSWQRLGIVAQVDPVQLLPWGVPSPGMAKLAPRSVQPQRQLSVHSSALLMMSRLLLWVSQSLPHHSGPSPLWELFSTDSHTDPKPFRRLHSCCFLPEISFS